MSSQNNLRIEQLGKDNFDTWKLQARAILIKNETWGYVDGSKVKPTENASAWENGDLKAQSDLILAINPSELRQIKNCTTSREIWLKLHTIYESKGPERKATLLKQLILRKMSETDEMSKIVEIEETSEKEIEREVEEEPEEEPEEDIHPEQIEMKRKPGRPKLIKTGMRGRPKKQYQMVPAVPIEEEEEIDEEVEEETVEMSNLIDVTEPESITEAMTGPQGDQWKEAMKIESEALMENKVWEFVDRPKNRRVIGSRWVLRTKFSADGSKEQKKARLVAKGFAQSYGIDYRETFAPVTRSG